MTSDWNKKRGWNVSGSTSSSSSSGGGAANSFVFPRTSSTRSSALNDFDFPALPSSAPAPTTPTSASSGAWGRRPVQQPPPSILRLSLSAAPVVSSSTRTSPPEPAPVVVECAPPTRPSLPDPDIAKLDLTASIPIYTNVFELEVKPTKVFRYNVTIRRFHKFVWPNGSQGINDPLINNSNDRKVQAECSVITKIALERLKSNIVYAYDGSRALYTPSRLSDDVMTCLTKGVHLGKGDTPADIEKAHFKSDADYFHVRLEANSGRPEWETGDLFNEMRDRTMPEDTSTKALIHIVLGQNARNRGFTLMAGGNEVYDMRRHEASDGRWHMLRDGIAPTVQLGESSQDTRPQSQLVVSYKQAMFFSPGSLTNLSEVVDFTDPDDMKRLVGLRVVPFYSKNMFTIKSITSAPMREVRTEKGESVLEMVKSAAAKGGFTQKNYNDRWFGVQYAVNPNDARRRKEFSFPVENVLVVENQKVTTDFCKTMVHQMPPNAKWNNLNEMAFAKDGVLENNDFLKAFGLTVKERVVAKGVQIQTPSIEYAGGFMVADILRKTDWSTPKIVNQKGGFVVPGKAREIVVLFNSSAEPASNQDRGAGRARKYMERLQESCRDYGMHVFNWAIEDLSSTYPGLPATVAIEKKMCALKGASLRPFVIYIDDRANKTHDVLKLMERFCEIPTQHVCFDVALRKGEKSEQSNCPQYVTMKLNLKGNGLNSRVKYADGAIRDLWGDGSNTLIIAYDVCHESGEHMYKQGDECDEPSCVGFAFNGTPHPEAFIGDFSYQGIRMERVNDDILRKRAFRIIEMYHAARKGKIPDKIVILRDGVPDNEYHTVRDNEFKAIKEGIYRFLTSKGLQKRPSFAIIIGTKRRAHRVFAKTSAGRIDNVPPFTAIDNHIVRHGVHELIFTAHRPNDGTSSPICVNVVLNEDVFHSNLQLVQFVGAMCCAGQTSNKIMSLPAPLKIADAYANRGSRLFVAYKKYLAVRNQDLPRTDRRRPDARALTDTLCYDTSSLRSRRLV